MDVISYQQYVEMSRAGERFVGHVAGLGQVLRWEPVSVTQDYSPTAPCTSSNGNIFHTMKYLPVIIPEPSVQTTPFLNAGEYAGWGGTAASAASLSNKSILVGSEYVKINSGGTLVRNLNRQTTVGKIAGSTGTWLYGTSVVLDAFAAANNEQTWEQAFYNFSINSVIYGIGYFCPPAGLAVGLLYLIFNDSRNHIAQQEKKSENGVYIHPNDNTKIQPVQEKLPPIPKKKTFPAYDPPEIKPKQ